MSDVKSIMIVGVGGQGSLLASRIMGNLLMKVTPDVKVSEVHGMSQRGGSVVTYVKYGTEVFSPVIELGEADVIISFELLEAARWVPYLKTGGKIISSTQKIPPMPVITGAAKYTADIEEKIRAKGCKLITADALGLAKLAGNSRSVNVVLLGILSTFLNIPEELWEQTITETVPQKFLEINCKAFLLGREYSLDK